MIFDFNGLFILGIDVVWIPVGMDVVDSRPMA